MHICCDDRSTNTASNSESYLHNSMSYETRSAFSDDTTGSTGISHLAGYLQDLLRPLNEPAATQAHVKKTVVH